MPLTLEEELDLLLANPTATDHQFRSLLADVDAAKRQAHLHAMRLAAVLAAFACVPLVIGVFRMSMLLGGVFLALGVPLILLLSVLGAEARSGSHVEEPALVLTS